MKQIHERQIDFRGKGGITSLKSAVGPQKQIAELTSQLVSNGLPPAGIICFGISQDGTNAHLIFVDPEVLIGCTAADIASISGVITKEDAIEMLLPGHNYASFISAMDSGVIVSAWDTGIRTDRLTDKAYENFCEAIFDTDGNVFSSESSTLLLLSRQGERTLCASRNKGTDQLTEIMTPINAGIPTFGIACKNIVIVAQMDGQQVFAINTDQITQVFETGERPKWIVKGLSVDKIEDFSLPVDKDGTTIIVTAVKNGKRLLVPAVVSLTSEKGFQITLCIGQSVIEIQKTDPAPQRIDVETGFVAARQNNGGPNRLHITTIEGYAAGNTAFTAMIDRATSGDFSRAIA